MKKLSFFQLDPRPQGAESNEAILASVTGSIIGVEVTIPALASQCLLNFDHHDSKSTAETLSACEQMLEWVTAKDGNLGEYVDASLVTVRPDADSVTAMAVFMTAVSGGISNPSVVSEVGQFDRLGPSAGTPSVLVSAIARKAADFKIPLEGRVKWISEILTGDGKEEEIAELVSAHDRELTDARKASVVEVHQGGVSIATVVSTHRFATTLGYESAPIVVAMNPEMPMDPKDLSKGVCRKFTVCRYDSHVPCDLPAALAELQAMESGWGGRGDIFGSPQGVSSELTLVQVLDVVKRHVK